MKLMRLHGGCAALGGILSGLFSPAVLASTEAVNNLNLTDSTVGYLALTLFTIAYLLVMGEEKLHLRKSKPVLVAAGLIWGMIGYIYTQNGMSEVAEAAFKHNLLEYAELLLFLLVAMTYINAMEERRLFDALRCWMVGKGFSLYQIFWLTGLLAFFISPIADNLTTALLMCAVVMKMGADNRRFITLSCINIVVAANAGGAFSPFGDITTLMVWQKGMVHFSEFFKLFLPSLVNFLVPALIMSLFISREKSDALVEKVYTKTGAKRIVLLFLFTISMAVCAHSLLGLPPVLGMMTGLGLLQCFGFYLRKNFPKALARAQEKARLMQDEKRLEQLGNVVPFDVFSRIARAEWDTLLFFYGVVLCVGGLGFMGYLSMVSHAMYTQWDPTYANIAIGVLSSIIDNIPVMFAVLTMNPDMALGQWLLVTLTAGVGGSLLSIGSAAGVALMGQARGIYTFGAHLKWTPVIALGYIASILIHLWLNSSTF
ncbi:MULTISPECIES: sodium:proton antiporter NhaD [Shewanella]|uniref:Sodium:proton antiporter NhaD n=1 Tax=Shewanella indica TaxID=768528 RepID=A0ABU4Q8P4_9GAMM|nr:MULTISPECIES: sodium:proton antiporter NhaD [Shewanella]OIN16723.1 sodium:proton antiporter [Shewanella algae]MCE9791195.1 sodium:proton antiporter NhaD [Shewanella indica]MDX6015216.1 sodium:proton antiporter NhaD [Shewanella indica]NDO75155.1 sodium:proton antiporter [Shewanella sp. SE1]TVP11040.1 sodium:proton antiporter [Shewanella sp. MSW]